MTLIASIADAELPAKYRPKNPEMRPKESIDVATLHEYFRVENNSLFWIKPYGKNNVGDPAGYISLGYWHVHLLKRTYKIHRVLWAMRHGQWPPSWIDHANGNSLDNSIENLRLCFPSQNSRNKKPFGALGVKGVSLVPPGRYQVTVNRRYMGRYDDLTEAAKVHDREARRVFGEFARLNYPDTP